MIGITELIIILIVAGVVFFGSQKISELGRALGRFAGEFKKGKMEVEKELKEIEKEVEETKKE
jgi:sec-independent protein translocase protein TatA